VKLGCSANALQERGGNSGKSGGRSRRPGAPPHNRHYRPAWLGRVLVGEMVRTTLPPSRQQPREKSPLGFSQAGDSAVHRTTPERGPGISQIVRAVPRAETAKLWLRCVRREIKTHQRARGEANALAGEAVRELRETKSKGLTKPAPPSLCIQLFHSSLLQRSYTRTSNSKGYTRQHYYYTHQMVASMTRYLDCIPE
jgi:hypothetical protein